MDLDDFDKIENQQSRKLKVSNPETALQIIDGWYAEINRRGRHMDLIGDYAGSEPFVLDGEIYFDIWNIKLSTIHTCR